MKHYKVAAASVVSLALLLSAPLALAKDEQSGSNEQDQSSGVEVNVAEHQDQAQVQSDTRVENDVEKSDGQEHASTTDQKGESEFHIEGDLRAHIGPALSALLHASSSREEDNNVAQEVQDVISEHASSSEHMMEAAKQVESRPGWLTLLIGSDFKNLGELRSELSTTQNSIDRLTKAKDKATSPTVQAEITTQIHVLEDTASTTEHFVKDNESKFSFLGWLFKFFNQ